MLRIRNILRENVLVRILACVIIGIILSEYYKYKIQVEFLLILFIITTIVFVLYTIYFLNKKNVTFNRLNGIIVYGISILLFIVIHYNNQEINHVIYHRAIQDSIIILKIKDNQQIKNSFISYPADILYNEKKVGQINLSVDSNTLPLNFADIVRIKNRIREIKNQDWPGSFNYKAYLNQNHIYHQLKISNDDIINIEASKPNFILEFSYNSRNRLIEILRKNIKEESVFELSAALLLGYRADLDKDVMNTFSKTGTIHIISVSGLHVGIIFFVLQWIVRKTRIVKSKIVESIILISAIWMYSLLTGLPPSVCRCSTMISFGIIARIIDQRTSAFNMLAGSALILLSIDTNMLFDIGFQLSYLAVSGILYLQKWLENIIYIKNKYLQQLWILTSVSIAAQLFTLPLCLYYFHQFPNYFIPANLIAIPLSSIALYTTILTIIFTPFVWLITVCDFILKWSLKIMNSSLNMIEKLPYSVSENIYINQLESLLLCIYIILLILLFVHKYRFTLKYILLLMIIHLIYDEFNKSTNIRINYISNNNTIPLYTYREENELKHVIPADIEQKRLNRFIKSWNKLGHFKHKIILYNKSEHVYVHSKKRKILIADRKSLTKIMNADVDYLISNSWYISKNINAKIVYSNKEIDSNIAVNISKTGYLVF